MNIVKHCFVVNHTFSIQRNLLKLLLIAKLEYFWEKSKMAAKKSHIGLLYHYNLVIYPNDYNAPVTLSPLALHSAERG